nr:centromere protein like [Tanacetum cinerariifolium]
MDELSSLWQYHENIDELKQKLLFKTRELKAVKADTNKEIKRNSESMKQMLQLLEVACQERDEARDQLQKITTMLMEHMIKGKTLPQKGNLVQAISEAGPLLQTVMVGGPMMVTSDVTGGEVLSFSDVKFGSPGINTFGTVGKRQRLH